MTPLEVKETMHRLRKRVEDLCHRNKLPFSPNTLGGACGICSFLAFRILKRKGLSPTFHINNDHCFVTVDLDVKYWVDLTLTQFVPTMELVFVADHPYRLKGDWIHRSNRRAKSLCEIRGLFGKWPDEQNPFKQKLPKISI